MRVLVRCGVVLQRQPIPNLHRLYPHYAMSLSLLSNLLLAALWLRELWS